MTPESIIAVLTLVEQVATQIPALYIDLKNLFAGGQPTAQDFANLKASVQAETYGQFVPSNPNPGT